MKKIASVFVLIAALTVFSCSERSDRLSPGTEKLIRETVENIMAKKTITPPTSVIGEFSQEKAYRIQAGYVDEMSRYLGDLAGYKVAYASKAAQEQFGIDEPASGPLFRLQRLQSGSSVPAAAVRQSMLEVEVAFTIGKKIDRPLDSVKELKPFVRYVHAAFDLGENRFDPDGPRPVVVDQIATGTGSHFFVHGPSVDPAQVDVNAVNLVLYKDGVELANSPATEVLGSPWNSLLWLANQVTARGQSLRPGDVVTTGTASPAYKASGDGLKGHYVGDCGQLGKVELTIF